MSKSLTILGDADAKFLVLSIDGAESKTREYKKRKHHTKDRRGCRPCKQRRVKCGQEKPICTRCVKARRECKYELSPQSCRPGSEQLDYVPSVASHTRIPPWSAVVVESIIAPQMQHGASVGGRGTSVSELLHHITDNLGVVFGMPLSPSLWDLTCRHPHLLAAMLAVSACHLRHLAVDSSQHRIAECLLQSSALSWFQPALAQPLTQEGSDALLLTSMMFNTLAFAIIDDIDPPKSWVLSNQGDGLGWLSIQLGLKSLLLATRSFRQKSLLWPIFVASDDENKTYSINCGTLERVPPAWARLISKEGDADESCLREPVRILAELRLLSPQQANIMLYVQFIGKIDNNFLRLLSNRDKRALWALGYWLGLIGCLGMWWCDRRVLRDWTAIRDFLLQQDILEGEADDEKEMWQQLMEDYADVREIS